MIREREVKVTVLGDSRGGQKALADLDDHAGRAENRLGSFAKTAALGFAGAGIAVGAFAIKAIGAGSDMAETVSKANTIFGESGKAIQDWASGAASGFGQSKQQALEAAGTFGNLFTQLGVGTDKAAGMSKQMVELASDFASFHNADPSEVLEAMTAAFRGEYDAVQRFVPTINAAAVEHKALEMGLAATTKELTAQDKALATQALLLEGAGAAAGDYDRTSKGLANRLRELKARGADFVAMIGTALVPIALKGVDVFEKVGKAAKGLFDIFAKGDFSGGIFGLQEDSPIIGALFKIREVGMAVAGFIRDNFVPVLAALGVVLVSILIPAVTTLVASVAALFSPVILVVGAIAAVVAGLVYAYQHFEGFRSVVDGVVQFLVGTVVPAIGSFVRFIVEQFANLVAWVQQHWRSIQEAIGHVVAVVQGVIENFVAIVQAVWQAWGDEILNIARIVWDQIRNVVETVVNLVRGIIEVGLALINGEWGAAWDGIKDLLATAWDFIYETVVNAVRLLREAVEGGLSAVVGLVGDLPGKVLDALGDLTGWLWDAGADLMRGMIEGIGSMAGRLADKAMDVVRGAVDKVKRFLGIDSPSKLFMGFGINVGQGFSQGLGKSEGAVARAGRSLATAAVPGESLASLSLASGPLGSHRAGPGSGPTLGPGSIVVYALDPVHAGRQVREQLLALGQHMPAEQVLGRAR